MTIAAPSDLMRPRTRPKLAPFPLSPMKAAFRPGSVGIGPGAPWRWLRAGVRAMARRAVITPTAMRPPPRWLCRTSRRILILHGCGFHHDQLLSALAAVVLGQVVP